MWVILTAVRRETWGKCMKMGQLGVCVCGWYIFIYIYVLINIYICFFASANVSSSQNCAALQTDDSCVMLWCCFLFFIFVFLFFFFFVFSFFSCFFVLLLPLLVPKFLWDHWTWLLFPIQYFTMSWLRLRCTFTPKMVWSIGKRHQK